MYHAHLNEPLEAISMKVRRTMLIASMSATPSLGSSSGELQARRSRRGWAPNLVPSSNHAQYFEDDGPSFHLRTFGPHFLGLVMVFPRGGGPIAQ